MDLPSKINHQKNETMDFRSLILILELCMNSLRTYLMYDTQGENIRLNFLGPYLYELNDP